MASSREDADEKTMYMLKKTFSALDKAKTGFIPTSELESVLNGMGASFDPVTLEGAITNCAEDDQVNFENFVCICLNFLEEEDEATITEDLRRAFRLYDKAGTGFIATKIIEELIKEMEPELSNDEVHEALFEFDEEGSGKISFKTFMKLLM